MRETARGGAEGQREREDTFQVSLCLPLLPCSVTSRRAERPTFARRRLPALYPKKPPTMTFEEPKGLSDAHLSSLVRVIDSHSLGLAVDSLIFRSARLSNGRPPLCWEQK